MRICGLATLLAFATVSNLTAPAWAGEGGEVADEGARQVESLQVQPGSLELSHRRRPASLLVTGVAADGERVDLTREATFTSDDGQVAFVLESGWVHAVGSGATAVHVSAAGRKAKVMVQVELPEAERPYSFRHEVMPVLSKGGCNQGACHGYSLGKNGFHLSLRGGDAAWDYKAITTEFLGRRINRHRPAASLMVAKPLGDLPHGGGVRFERGSLEHEILLGWIGQGAAGDLDDPVKLESVEIHPRQAVLEPGRRQQLQLLAHYTDGTTRDVTKLGVFSANNERIAGVNAEGLVEAGAVGETAIVARFERKFAVSNTIVLRPVESFEPTPVPEDNFIDRHVVTKLNALKTVPSPPADDATYLRRVYVDLIGVQPKPDEVRAFLADDRPDKRLRVADELMQQPEFVDHWSLKWGDLLQNSRSKLSDPAVYAFREWIRGAVASNMPLDEFAREVLTGRGGHADDPTSAYYVVSKDTEDTVERVAQVFCGVRMLCAKCHAHPFENWTQVDYFGVASFFNQVTTKADPRLAGDRKAKVVLLNLSAPFAVNPRTGQRQAPRFLAGEEAEIEADIDRREAFARWLTSAENPFFARSMANRIWSYFFHRGIIDPVDDMRSTNPPINPELLDALVADFVEHGFDMRHLMRRIVSSRTYQRSSQVLPGNAHDEANFARAVPRRLPAEAMLDSLVQATGVPERFRGAPAGFSAAQLPDAEVGSDFLDLFGKPQRMEACECERDNGSNMLQALHFINGESILGKVSANNGRVAGLAGQKLSDRELAEELYLWALARPPKEEELKIALEHFAAYGEDRRAAAQDLMWALLNSKSFMLLY